MNKIISDLLKNEKPKISILTPEQKKVYEIGLNLLGIYVPENFLDGTEIIGEDKYRQTGYVYEIPYFHADMLYDDNGQVMLLVLYEIKTEENGNKSSYCPLRIDFKMEDKDNYALYIYRNSKRTEKRIFIEHANGEYITEIYDFNKKNILELL